MSAKQTLDLLIGTASNAVTFFKSQIIFRQGDPADTVFYIDEGTAKLTVISNTGKEAILAILADGDFLGEGSIAGQPLRMESATAMTYCSVLRIKKHAMLRSLHREPELANLFIACLLARNIQYEENLVHQLLNNSEKRLARILQLLARFSEKPTIPNLNQTALAEMVGTTRSRINFFMNKFRMLGFIDYGKDGIQVNSSLLSVLRKD
jgi:CRP/FNR family cyclic AMP-dependent transcriptional regulator